MKKIDLLIVEDHDFTRQTLTYQLKKHPKVNFLAALKNGQEAVDYVRKTPPEVILMDIEMPVLDGISATKEIKEFNPDIKIIILTSHGEKEKVFAAFSSGANGYCVKDIDIFELIYVIETVKDGGIWFDKQIAAFVLDVLKNNEAQNVAQKSVKTAKDYGITQREQNILKLISDGLSNSDIAETLVLSVSTVKNHVSSIINKLAVKDRTQIALKVVRDNLLN